MADIRVSFNEARFGVNLSGKITVNDYIISAVEVEAGIVLTIQRGSEVQTVELHGLSEADKAEILDITRRASEAAESATEIADTVRAALERGELNGKTPVRGEDYWTDSDKREIVYESAIAASDMVAQEIDYLIDAVDDEEKRAKEAEQKLDDSIKQTASTLNEAINGIEREVDKKQDKLVSGQNVKTVNGESILGGGNIVIKGGGAVDSVNGKTGAVVLNASDVGALPNSTKIPSTTSDLTNDSGFLTQHQSLAAYRTSAQQDVIDDGKQPKINDLDEIRDGAALGATSIQGSIDPTRGEEIPRGNGLDVRINGESIVEGGVAEIPVATTNAYGLVRPSNGLYILADGGLATNNASDAQIDAKSSNKTVLTPQRIDRAVRAGLISNSQITDADKPLICETIGAVQNPKWELLYSFDGDDSTKELIYSVELVHMYYTISVDGGIEVPTISVYGYNSDTGTSLTDNMLMYHYNGGRSGATSAAKATGRLLKLGNMYRFESSTYTTRTNTSTLNRMNYDGVDEIISENNLHKLRFTVSSSTVFCRGIHIEVYGVRA